MKRTAYSKDRNPHSISEMLNWDDVRLFLEVARTGGLAAARAGTRLSAPTLGRRITALEQTLGISLFVRHREGYDLTDGGQEFLALAERFEEGSIAIERWRDKSASMPVVRIAAGSWTAAFVAGHMRHLTTGKTKPRIEILSGSAVVDLHLRHANMGIRNRRPEAPGLAGRKLTTVAFAIYAGRNLSTDLAGNSSLEALLTDCPWIEYAPEQATTPSAAWLSQRLRNGASLRVSCTQSVLAAAKDNAGLCVLPCFVGDKETGLVRLSAPIKELSHSQWLVTHNDDRHTAPIRRVANALAQLIRSNRSLFVGDEIQTV